MPKTFKLPAGITRAEIEKAAGGVSTPWQEALLLTAEGKSTAQKIADVAGVGRSTLFARMKKLEVEGKGGLERLLQRNNHRGRAPRITGSNLDAVKSQFKSGETTKEIQAWLATPPINIKMSADGINYYKEKGGFVQKRSPSRTPPKPPVRRRQDQLLCHVDELTMQKLEFLFTIEPGKDETRAYRHLPRRAHRTLAALRALGKRTNDIEAIKCPMTPGEKHKFSGGEIARKYKTPLASLYRVAALVRAANSEWNRFVKLAFSKRGQELVSGEMPTDLTGYFNTNQSGSNQPVNPSELVPRFTKLSDIL